MTIFEKIIAREVPAQIIAESEDWIAFHDVNPQAPVHALVIPKRAIPRLADSTSADDAVLATLLPAVREVACKLRVDATGFRVVINSGKDGGETVPHLHLHLLAGRPLGWPPG